MHSSITVRWGDADGFRNTIRDVCKTAETLMSSLGLGTFGEILAETTRILQERLVDSKFNPSADWLLGAAQIACDQGMASLSLYSSSPEAKKAVTDAGGALGNGVAVAIVDVRDQRSLTAYLAPMARAAVLFQLYEHAVAKETKEKEKKADAKSTLHDSTA